jgi:hypothetical protein
MEYQMVRQYSFHFPWKPVALKRMEPPSRILERVLAPNRGFRRRAAAGPGLAEAVVGMLLWRTPTALAGLALGYAALARAYAQAIQLRGPLWEAVLSRLPEPLDPGELRAALQGLPALPGWERMLPWLALLAPLGVLSLWLHDATWDHLALWLLRGTARERPVRATLVAEAEALKVGVVGALAGLLAQLPGTGLATTLLLLPVSVYFWILRGYALAAWHGCPPWKGVLATLLHALIMGILGGAVLLLGFLLLYQAGQG